jgi:hypothetical protein
VASEPEALLAVLKNPAYHFKRIGLDAGPLSQWLFSALAEAGLSVICVETRHMQAVLKAQINKTDRNDARGIAQMMRAGLYRPVHVKTIRSQKLRMLLTHRKLLQSKAIAIENDPRGTLRNFGLKVGMVGKVKFEARIRELTGRSGGLRAFENSFSSPSRRIRCRAGAGGTRTPLTIPDTFVGRKDEPQQSPATLKLCNFFIRSQQRVTHDIRHSDRSSLMGRYLLLAHGRLPGGLRGVRKRKSPDRMMHGQGFLEG